MHGAADPNTRSSLVRAGVGAGGRCSRRRGANDSAITFPSPKPWPTSRPDRGCINRSGHAWRNAADSGRDAAQLPNAKAGLCAQAGGLPSPEHVKFWSKSTRCSCVT
mgnify:CR=1 FL=1